MFFAHQTRARKSILASAETAVTPFIATAERGDTPKKEILRTEKIKVLDQVDWLTAERGINDMIATLRNELADLRTNTTIQNAYSPVTWVKLCRQIQHVREGMTCVRMASEGKTTEEIGKLTGIDSHRIGAFRAWNTIWKRAIERVLTIKFRNEQERQSDIEFLRSIGIAVNETKNPKAGAQ